MAESVELVAELRRTNGSRAARRLRRQGRIPAVLYGHKQETVALALQTEDLVKAIRHGARVVDLKTNGNVEKALIREVQWDHLGKEILHVDFTRVAADERIVVPVRVEIRGTAPGVAAGGILDQPLHTLEVECPALNVPESIRVNVSELQVGGVIYVRDLVLPPDVKAMTDPDAVVVHVTAPVAEPEAGPAPAPEQAEPEVIGRQREAKKEEEEK
ncbi:MAG TPA: 50S ribosomal protein L25 [Gemmataceae bacterium]|nr:50S ribosomal protein L25 [Gemmataceae bacterium]